MSPPVMRLVTALLMLLVLFLAGCSDEPSTTPTAVTAPETTAAPTTASTLPPAPETTAAPTTVTTAAPESQAAVERPIPAKRGYSDDHGSLSQYVKPVEIDGAGRKLLAVYMVGSDLEEYDLAGSLDLEELVLGYDVLTNQEDVEIVVAFGGANKDGWRGMKIANVSQLTQDYLDLEFGNETGPDAYLYKADGAHMGDEGTLKLFLDYLRDRYVNFDKRFLTFWDHGNSYRGFGNDSNFNEDPLYLDEMAGAFNGSQAGIFDLIGFDACFMASVEVAKAIEPHARYMIASEEVEPGHGWLWSAVIEAFAEEDSIVEAGKRMVDNFVQDVHFYYDTGKTLSLLDLSQYDNLIDALDPVVSTLGARMFDSEVYSDGLIAAEAGARSYAVSEREGSRVSMDLTHFTQLLAERLSDTGLSANLDRLMDAVDNFVVHSKHDGTRPNSFGIAIDAPENTDAEYAAYKVNDTWLDFQSLYEDFRLGDLEPPVVTEEFSDSDGTFATVLDENLAKVTTLYGFIEPVEYGDGTVEDIFMVVAEEEAYLTEIEDVYLASTWDQVWFTVEYDPGKDTAWIPAFFSGRFEKDGLEYIIFTAEIDYHRAAKDYSGYEFPYDLATMSLIVHDDGESWEIVYYSIETYKFLFSGPDDEIGTVQVDKATFEIFPGDEVQFSNFGFSLEDPANDQWFYTADGLLTFVQEPVFQFEFLEFEDESGELIDYYYAIWAEDAAGNTTLGDLIPAERVVDSPFGNMQIFVDPYGYFEVQTPQHWIEEEPNMAEFEIFKASDSEGNGAVVVYVEEGKQMALAEYADAIESGLIETGTGDLTRETVETVQGLPAILFEGSTNQEAFTWMIYLSDDGVAIDIVYSFPIGQFDTGRELAYYSFGTFLVE